MPVPVSRGGEISELANALHDIAIILAHTACAMLRKSTISGGEWLNETVLKRGC